MNTIPFNYKLIRLERGKEGREYALGSARFHNSHWNVPNETNRNILCGTGGPRNVLRRPTQAPPQRDGLRRPPFSPLSETRRNQNILSFLNLCHYQRL